MVKKPTKKIFVNKFLTGFFNKIFDKIISKIKILLFNKLKKKYK